MQQEDTTAAVQNALVDGKTAGLWAPVVIDNNGTLLNKEIAEAMAQSTGDDTLLKLFSTFNITFQNNGTCAMGANGETQSGTYEVSGTDIAIKSDADGSVETVSIDAETGALVLNMNGMKMYLTMTVSQ